MLPKEVFNRRPQHRTPETFSLILANYIVVGICISLFISHGKINWFFWVAMGLLALYNVYNIRFNRAIYNKPAIIAYIISVAGLSLLFFLFGSK